MSHLFWPVISYCINSYFDHLDNTAHFPLLMDFSFDLVNSEKTFVRIYFTFTFYVGWIILIKFNYGPCRTIYLFRLYITYATHLVKVYILYLIKLFWKYIWYKICWRLFNSNETYTKKVRVFYIYVGKANTTFEISKYDQNLRISSVQQKVYWTH